MKILITGGHGQLGRDAAERLRDHYEVFAFGREELDITNEEVVNSCIRRLSPDIVLHTAAHTQVDQAEQEFESAYRINAIGTRNVAVAVDAIGAKLIHISTDYVFDGRKETPYIEFDHVNPINVYGKSKLAAEEIVQRFCRRHFILRISWVYGKHGKNFVKTMLDLAKKTDVLKVVYDQVGAPTYTADVIRFTEQLFDTELYGIYHASNSGNCSWYEFAKAVFEEFNINGITVNPVDSSEFPYKAARPHNSRMEHLAIRLNNLVDLPHWRDGLRRFRQELTAEEGGI